MTRKRNDNVEFLVMLFSLFLATLSIILVLIFVNKSKTPVLQELKVDMNVEKSSTIEMNASGYSIGPPYNSITKSGHSVISLGYLKIGDENIFTVASDKKVLPLGSLIYIDSLGIGMVQDTGSEIKGNDLDICFQTMDQAKQFGKKKVKVILLRKGDLK